MDNWVSILGSGRNFGFFHSLQESLLILSYRAGLFARSVGIEIYRIYRKLLDRLQEGVLIIETKKGVCINVCPGIP
jgi:hypothetical protein